MENFVLNSAGKVNMYPPGLSCNDQDHQPNMGKDLSDLHKSSHKQAVVFA